MALLCIWWWSHLWHISGKQSVHYQQGRAPPRPHMEGAWRCCPSTARAAPAPGSKGHERRMSIAVSARGPPRPQRSPEEACRRCVLVLLLPKGRRYTDQRERFAHVSFRCCRAHTDHARAGRAAAAAAPGPGGHRAQPQQRRVGLAPAARRRLLHAVAPRRAQGQQQPRRRRCAACVCELWGGLRDSSRARAAGALLACATLVVGPGSGAGSGTAAAQAPRVRCSPELVTFGGGQRGGVRDSSSPLFERTSSVQLS